MIVLTPRNEMILRMYYGIGEPAQGTKAIAARFCITPQRTRTLLREAVGAVIGMAGFDQTDMFRDLVTRAIALSNDRTANGGPPP